VEKYGGPRQATDDKIIRRMRFACWIKKVTYTHSANVILLLFHNSVYVIVPQCDDNRYVACFVHHVWLLLCDQPGKPRIITVSRLI